MKNLSKGKKIAVIFGAFILLVILLPTTGSDADKKDEPAKKSEDTAKVENKETQKETMSESDAEKYCQDENLTPILVANYKDVSAIDMWSYNKTYTDGGGYDKSGYPIMLLSWNGKDKKLDEKVSFTCFLSGTKDNPELHYLGMNTEALRGSLDFQSYNKDGEPIE